MLSVLIPTFNHTCTALVTALLQQAKGLDVEIVVAEDGTTDPVALASNRWIAEMPCCRYLPLKENMGRAKIRNFLATEAKGERLLFLDDDVIPACDDFLHRYMATAAPVVCGGVKAAKKPQPHRLRWRWEKASEKKMTAERRSRQPHAHFASANFMIDRTLFLSMPFDESIKEYGYEDALFGISLMHKDVPVTHITAPVYHNGVDTNPQFLAKTEQALRTLRTLPLMQPYATVARTARRMRFLSPCLRPLTPLFRRLALGRHPRVWALQAYKLCFYLGLKP